MKFNLRFQKDCLVPLKLLFPFYCISRLHCYEVMYQPNFSGAMWPVYFAVPEHVGKGSLQSADQIALSRRSRKLCRVTAFSSWRWLAQIWNKLLLMKRHRRLMIVKSPSDTFPCWSADFYWYEHESEIQRGRFASPLESVKWSFFSRIRFWQANEQNMEISQELHLFWIGKWFLIVMLYKSKSNCTLYKYVTAEAIFNGCICLVVKYACYSIFFLQAGSCSV